MKIRGNDQAVAEIVGAMVILAIAVAAFSVIYLNVLSNPGPSEETYVTLIGKMEPESGIANTVAFENRRGEKLGLDTKIMLEVHGDSSNYTINELASTYSFLQDGWDIGEKIFPKLFDYRGDLTGSRIDATIVDKKSNSIIFWGRLQEGAIGPRGGIWHFDEDAIVWDTEQIDGVIDSSGNGNHGTAKGGATSVNDAMSGRSGYFDYFGTAKYVEVIPKDPYSLNLKDIITVEAWMKPFEFNPHIETQKYSNLPHGYESDIIHISNDVYAIACRGDSPHPGKLDTLTISSDGKISDNVIDELTFDRRCWNPNIVHVSDNIYAIAYTGTQEQDGFVKTVWIEADGQIGNSVNDTLEFDTSYCFEPNIIHVSGDFFAVAYRGPDNDGFLKTISIDTNNGQIADSVIDYWEFDEDDCYNPDLLNISEGVFAVVYSGPGINPNNFGILKTFIIAPNGQIPDSNPTLYALQFDNIDCNEPDIIHVSDYNYALVYNRETGSINPKGVVIELTISSNGDSVTYSGIPLLYPLPTEIHGKCQSPKIILISPRIYAVVYRSMTSQPLQLTTIRSRDPTPPWYRGIFKFGSINIYCDETNVYASLTTEDNLEHHITLEKVITPDNWYHIVLTFNGSKIRLYCNKEGDSFTKILHTTYNESTLSVPTPKTIKIPITSKLYFGYLFNGYIDEIAIHNQVLTDNDLTDPPTDPSSIQYHFYYPGIFEDEP